MSVSRLGSWRVEEELGRGGMGVVHVAVHADTGRRGAIKILLPESADPERLARFFQEATAAAQIHHPGIVEVLDSGREGEHAYLVMELLQGESLGGRLRRMGRVPQVLALDVVRQVARAVGAAHAKGIVHRDLKPDNLMLVPDTAMTYGFRVKVLDFGVAKLVGTDRPIVTLEGQTVGTPLYMAPEQCLSAARAIGPRADVYALGVILYQMVRGDPPFVRPSVQEVLAAHVNDPVPPLPRASRAVETLVLQMLLKDPAARIPTMEAVVEAIDALAA
jgi:serine/threonine-protein kinase